MKKVNNSLHLIFLVFLLISALSLVACEFFPTNEECSHESTEWVIDKNPTCTETGARHKVCTLCDKPSRRKVPLVPDYCGAEIPDEFIVGYGLDYAEKYRNLPYIGILKRSVYE